MKEKSKETAVDFLVAKLTQEESKKIPFTFIIQAKELERNQIVEFGAYISEYYGSLFGFQISERIISNFYNEFLNRINERKK